jgi:integrase
MKDGVVKRGATYTYVVRERDPETGKTKPRWVSGFKTRKAAKNARDAARNAVNRGTYVAPRDITVAAYLELWMAAHEVELKPSTAASYRAKIRLYLVPSIGHERVQSLSPSRLSVLWKELHQKGGKAGKPVSVRTVEFARAVLRRAMTDAVIDRVVEINPVVGSKMPKRDGKARHKTWTGSQLASFLGSISDSRLFSLWELAAATGMRRGELMGLRWCDVDFDTAVVSIDRSTTQIGKEVVTTTPKNHERRQVTIDTRTVATLKAWRRSQAAERLQWGAAYQNPDDVVFTWEDGRSLLPDYVSKAFIQAQEAVVAEEAQQAKGEDRDPSPRLPRLVLHELRHTHATMLLREGVPVHVVAKRLGHKDPSVTLNVYADVIPDDDGRAVDVFSRAVWGA